MENSRLTGRSPTPRLIFLFATLVFTVTGTSLLCTAIMSDHWEEVSWDKEALQESKANVKWFLDSRVARVEPMRRGNEHNAANKHRNNNYNNNNPRSLAPAFLVPMHGGIWTMCVSLSEDEILRLSQLRFPQSKCINYLYPDEPHEEIRAAWQNRMQNLSISCSLVCLIILGSAVIVGLFGILTHQVSAVMITGVMYLLAAIFALFTLTIIHSKRNQDRMDRIFQGPEDGVLGGPIDKNILKARRFATSWSVDFGWGGVTLTSLASVAWILLSKIMRFSPVTTLIT